MSKNEMVYNRLSETITGPSEFNTKYVTSLINHTLNPIQVGLCLANLANAGKLVRVKPGIFRMPTPGEVVPKRVKSKKKPSIVPTKDSIESIENLITACELLKKENDRLTKENSALVKENETIKSNHERLNEECMDMKRCIDSWGARVRESKILPLKNYKE